MKKLVATKFVKEASLHSKRPIEYHIYALPFLPVYLLFLYIRLFKYELLGSSEFVWFWLLMIFALHALSFLVGKWNIKFKSWTTCNKETDPTKADVILVQPVDHAGSAALCDLIKQGKSIYFYFQKKKFIFDAEKKTFVKLQYLHKPRPFSDYTAMKGLQDTKEKLDLYGKNSFDVPIPTFKELFLEHIMAPFFVFQLFCVALWFMDDMWYYSLFTLFMLFVFESTVVFQRLRTLQEFRSMSIKPYPIQVCRNKVWKEISSDELLPGDLCSVKRQKDEDPIPADMLLLNGSCIVNEAMLSGESTPQIKEPVNLREGSDIFNMQSDKLHILYGGTKVLQVSAATPDGGCLAVVLRTGFATQQGKLVRTIIFSNERVTANNIEALFFILFLLVFAIIAAWYVWTEGSKLEDRDHSKLLLHCILIITSVVPPELPMELSLAVNNSLISLARAYIFCTEPFRIPLAGRLDVVCFDKTGTLTEENLIMEGVAGLDKKNELIKPDEIPTTTKLVLATAHALIMLSDGVIGDPMEKNTLESIEWNLSSDDQVSSKKSKTSCKILRRFQFSSALKRMSTLSLYENKTLVSVKGAPETLQDMFKSIPSNYTEMYKEWARKGKRVLALGYKYLPKLSPKELQEIKRGSVESDLIFAGFLIFYCPLKSDSIASVQALNASSHRCIMITGDNALTASHVAKEVEIVSRTVLIGHVEDEFRWQSVKGDVTFDFDSNRSDFDPRLDSYDLCLTGEGLSALADKKCFESLLPRVWIYARVSPSQKEWILTKFKQHGYYTLMCGDGTNDVGALKQAHIGIALLDTTPEDLERLNKRLIEQRRRAILQKQEELRKRWGLPEPPPQANAPNGMDKLMDSMADMEEDVPRIKFGDASVAAPFTSKVSSVMSVVNIVRQGRATLVATIQMYKILALNSLIMAYSLSVLHLAGIKQGDWQATIAGMLITVCFFGIAQSKAVGRLSKERPQPNIFNYYIILTVLGQSLVHVISLIYIRNQALLFTEESEHVLPVDAEFSPNLLNSAVYLVSLIMQISTFAINYQGLPFRESIFQNKALFNSLAIVSAIAFAAASEISEDLNDWVQLVAFPDEFRNSLLMIMAFDYLGAFVIEKITFTLFANNRPKASLFPGNKE